MRLAATRHDRVIMAVLIALACLLPVWTALAHRAIAPTLLLMGLAVATRAEPWRLGVAAFLTRPDWTRPLTRAAVFFSAFCAWTAITAIWAPRHDASLALNIFAPVFAGGAVIWEISRRRPQDASRIGAALAVAGAAAIMLIAFEGVTGGFLRSITPPDDVTLGRTRDMIAVGRGATIIMVTIFGALLLLYRRGVRRAYLVLFFAAALFAALRLEIFSNVAGMLLGAFVFAAALSRPRLATILFGALMIAMLIFAPLAVLVPADRAIEELAGLAPVSWLQRLVIWRTAAEHALSCLPLGCGADYARTIAREGGKIVIPGAAAPLNVMPLHPHNLFLQIWLEMGLPGALLFGGALASAIQALHAARLSALEKAAVAATAAGFFVSAMVEASLWQVWRLCVPMLAGAYIAAARQQRLLAEAKTSHARRPQE